MAQTNIPYGATQALKLQAAGLFAATMQRNTTLNRLTGAFPTQGDAEANLRQQSSQKMPIVKCMDLTKLAGDEVLFDLINPMGGKPIMGGAMAQGRGAAMSFTSDKLRINQTRKPISAGDTMTQQRTKWELRNIGRALGQDYMDRLTDQSILVHLAGSRGFHNNIEWAIPLASDPDFASIMINTVRAPTKNRHYISTGSGIEPMGAAANVTNVATTDVMNADVVDGIRTVVDSMALPPSPVIFNGDKLGADSPIRVLLVSSEQYTSFVQSTGFRTLQANAMARSSQAGNNPLFTGDAGLWNGILIVKMPKPIRFYAGNEVKWCASNTTETETTGDLVNANFGTGYAVDRALLLGGQALAEAWGKNRHSGSPFFWEEEETDFKDKLEMVIGAINGRSKIRFLIDYGDSQQYTDNGVIAIDTAVKIAGV